MWAPVLFEYSIFFKFYSFQIGIQVQKN